MDALTLIQERKSSQGLYDSGRLMAEEDLQHILEAACWAPTPHNMQNFEIVIAEDRKLLKSIVDLRQSVSGGRFRAGYQDEEAYASSEEELLRKKLAF